MSIGIARSSMAASTVDPDKGCLRYSPGETAMKAMNEIHHCGRSTSIVFVESRISSLRLSEALKSAQNNQ
jgi:hypothetical protein